MGEAAKKRDNAKREVLIIQDSDGMVAGPIGIGGAPGPGCGGITAEGGQPVLSLNNDD